MIKFSIILGNLGNTCDRFLSSGYKEQPSKEEMLKQASKIAGVKGVELIGNWDISEKNTEEMANLLKKYKLECVAVIPDLFSQKRWGKGTFASKDKRIRGQAIDETVKMARIARKLKCQIVNIWPGQDGYDYPFQADYTKEKEWIIQGIRTVAKKFPDIRFALEYKMKEPRTHCFLARTADTLMAAIETGCKNVGVTIDTGHAFLAYENIAEAAVMLVKHKKLFHLHFNDNYSSWDDDMIVGSVHLTEYAELFYWLKALKYDGWYSMDQYPYREDAKRALEESVKFLKGIDSMFDAASMKELRNIIKEGDATKSTAWLRKKIFK